MGSSATKRADADEQLCQIINIGDIGRFATFLSDNPYYCNKALNN